VPSRPPANPEDVRKSLNPAATWLWYRVEIRVEQDNHHVTHKPLRTAPPSKQAGSNSPGAGAGLSIQGQTSGALMIQGPLGGGGLVIQGRATRSPAS
jgi:hypothetical protein